MRDASRHRGGGRHRRPEYVRDLEAMEATLERLDRARMAAEASAFSAALARDLIEADDFRS